MSRRATIKGRALFWAVATGLFVIFRVQVAWWHPACAISEDGVVDFGYGFPLPFLRPVIAGATSPGFFVMPHLFILDVVILAAAVYPLYRVLIRRLAGWKEAAGMVFLFAGLIVCLLEIAPIVMLQSEFTPVRSIALGEAYSENYFSFRPAFWAAWQGKRACPA